MFNWFKKKDIGPVMETIVVEGAAPEKAPEAPRVPNGSPQVKDFPRSLYDAYWETAYTVKSDRHIAKVKFYTYQGKLLSESEITAASKAPLFEKVNTLISTKMPNFKKKV
jgi:hypothetical protein